MDPTHNHLPQDLRRILTTLVITVIVVVALSLVDRQTQIISGQFLPSAEDSISPTLRDETAETNTPEQTTELPAGDTVQAE